MYRQRLSFEVDGVLVRVTSIHDKNGVTEKSLLELIPPAGNEPIAVELSSRQALSLGKFLVDAA